MDLEPCFKVPNLVVIQLHNTKLGHMTNLQVVFQMMVQFVKCIQFATRSSPLVNLEVANTMHRI